MKFADLVRAVTQQGWTVTRTGNGHFRFQAPNGALVFGTGPRSHGDHRAIKNLISHLRKAGAVLGKQQATHT